MGHGRLSSMSSRLKGPFHQQLHNQMVLVIVAQARGRKGGKLQVGRGSGRDEAYGPSAHFSEIDRLLKFKIKKEIS